MVSKSWNNVYKNNLFTKYLCSRVVRIYKPSTFHSKTSEQALLSPNTSALFRQLENIRQIYMFFILYLLKYSFLEISVWWIKFCVRIEVRIWHFVLWRGISFLKKILFCVGQNLWLPGFQFLWHRGFQLKLFINHYMWHDETI